MDQEWRNKVEPHVKGKRIVVITPIHRTAEAPYLVAMIRTIAYAKHLGCDVDFIGMLGQSVIPKARNQLVYDVLAYEDKYGPCIPFLIDSDIGWTPEDFFYQVSLVVKNDWPILGTNYPKKQLLWENVKEFVNGLLTKAYEAGKSGEPLVLIQAAQKLIQASFNWAATLPDTVDIDSDGCMELYGLPAGFLVVQTKVFRHLKDHLMTYQEHHNNVDEEMHEWFLDRHVGPPKKGYLLGEDISFFHHITKLAKSGEEPWGTFKVTPCRCYMLGKLSHTGSYDWVARAVDDYLEAK